MELCAWHAEARSITPYAFLTCQTQYIESRIGLQELQQRAEAAVHEAKSKLETEQDRLLHIAGMVQLFHEQIMQVLPKVPGGRGRTEI